MASVASGGKAERIAARTLFKVLRAGSGTAARYSSVVFGAARPFAAEPRLRAFDFFIRAILQGSLLPFYPSDLSVVTQFDSVTGPMRHQTESLPTYRFVRARGPARLRPSRPRGSWCSTLRGRRT